MVKPKSKAKPKRKQPGAGRRRGVVELKAKEPRTVQKTVRVPVSILAALEEEVAAVGSDKLSVPAAIVQILEDWNRKRSGLTTKTA